MSLADIFNSDAFNLLSLTTAFEKLPHRPGRIGQLGLFSTKGIATTTFVTEERDGIITLLPTRPRGSPSTLGKESKRTVRSFTVDHIPHDDTILADQVQGVREFGSEDKVKGVAKVVNDRLASMKANFETTFEHLRAGAIKGVVYDADGTTVLHNLFTEFGLTEVDVDFVLGTDGTNMQEKVLEVVRSIEDNLGAASYTRIHCLCHKDWFQSFVSHAKIQAAYARWRDGEFLRTDPRKGFEIFGVTFEEYRGSVGNVSFIPTNTARFFPMGVQDLFQMIFGPADFMETVNTIGKPLYAKQEPMAMNRGTHLHTQSNPFAMCTRPVLCVKGSTSN